MADQSRLSYGLEKLNKALDALEASVGKFSTDQKSQETSRMDIKSLKAQKSELENELVRVKAREVVLQDANNEVSERLGAAAENIRNVLRAV